MKPDSYPFTTIAPWDKIVPRPLLPIHPPPEPLERPALPGKQRESCVPSFALSTHIFPACHIRRGTSEPVVLPPTTFNTMEEKDKVLKAYTHELRTERQRAMRSDYCKVLWNCANRYWRKRRNRKNRTGLTLLFAHANGFNKEIWEPTLVTLLASQAGTLIDEVWSFESIQHGDAGLINRGSLSKYFEWADNTRDIVNFLVNFMPGEATSTRLPLHLDRLPEPESAARLTGGFASRRFMMVGHSLGGCTLAQLAEVYPGLVDSLVLIDPVITKPDMSEIGIEMWNYFNNILLQKFLMKSREEARETFLKSSFFQRWDPNVLRVYVETALYDTQDDSGQPAVKLKMPGVFESIVFAERTVGMETWQNLDKIPERIALRWVMPDVDDPNELGPPGIRAERCWTRPKNSTNIGIKGSQHLVPLERPVELGEDLGEFVLESYSHLRPSPASKL